MDYRNIHACIDIDLTVSGIDLVVDRLCPPDWVHEQKTERKNHALVFILEGGARFKTQDITFHVSKGDILYLQKGDRYCTYANPGPCYHFIVANFSAADPQGLLPQVFANAVIRSANPAYFGSVFRELSNLWSCKGIGYKIKCKAVLYDILFNLYAQAKNAELQSGHLYRIKSAVNYLEGNFTSDISIAALASRSHMSVTHFRRLFRQVYQLPPLEYIVSLRVNKAKDLIRSRMYSIGEVAEQVGYTDIAYFSRVFKKTTGKSPTEYLKNP